MVNLDNILQTPTSAFTWFYGFLLQNNLEFMVDGNNPIYIATEGATILSLVIATYIRYLSMNQGRVGGVDLQSFDVLQFFENTPGALATISVLTTYFLSSILVTASGYDNSQKKLKRSAILMMMLVSILAVGVVARR